MKNRFLLLMILMTGIGFASCSKKTIPAVTENANGVSSEPTKKLPAVSATDYAKEEAKKAQQQNKPPLVIVVSDQSAKKTTAGKYYYELNGYRYWKNDQDGKYYLDGTKPASKKPGR
jgi:hypothetical protein